MKILYLYKDYYPVVGGIENHLRVLAEAQAAAGHDVTVLVCDPGKRTRTETLNGVKVIKAGRLGTAFSMPLSFLQPLLTARQRPDMVHVHSPYPLGELSAWLFQRKVPLVISHHSDIVKQKTILRFYGPILKRVIRRAARIVATNPVYIQTSRWLKPVEEKCVVVSSSVDQHLYHPPTEAFEGPPTLLFVGRLRYYKGLDTLLRALPDLPGVTVRIAGEGPMKAEWEVLATALKVKDQVEFIGHVADEDLPELYRKAHLFVLPANARSEAFGLVMVEAMSCGLPCITTEIGTGTSWVVQDGVTGLVVPPKDPAALASAIRSLLDDPDRRASMAVAARQRVELHFSHERMVEGMTKIYEELVPGQRSDGVFGKGNA